MFGAGKLLGKVGSQLRQQHQRRRSLETRQCGQVHAQHAVAFGAGIELGLTTSHLTAFSWKGATGNSRCPCQLRLIL